MPLYDIECKSCKQVQEVQLKIKELTELRVQGNWFFMAVETQNKINQCCWAPFFGTMISPLKTKHSSWWKWRPIE